MSANRAAPCSSTQDALPRAKPKHIISDKGVQFTRGVFKNWCGRRNIKQRFGAVGRHGSIAVVERFMRTMKEEGLRRTLLPLGMRNVARRVASFIAWYNIRRPHTSLGGRTPEERYRQISAACHRPRYEPRPDWPAESSCAAPAAKVRGKPGAKLELTVNWHDADMRLPIIKLTRVA